MQGVRTPEGVPHPPLFFALPIRVFSADVGRASQLLELGTHPRPLRRGFALPTSLLKPWMTPPPCRLPITHKVGETSGEKRRG